MSSTSTEIFIIVIILIIPFLYESSKAFRYYLKFFLYYGIIMLTSIIVIPIMIWHPRDVRNLVLASMLCNHISRLLGLNWELKGRQYLEKEEACVIVANHQSSLDILGMFELWPVMQKCTVVAKKELFYAWPFGIAAWLCGLIFIDRLNSESAKTAINCSIEQLKTDKVKLWIFPEGTRKNTGEIHSFKKGAFHTAINAELPILPIVFTEFYFLDKYQKRLDTGHIVITVLPPISTKGLSQSDVPKLAESTRQLMVDAFNKATYKLKEELLL
ncbi:1-acyl-sn-glycerol-3-phosphate acyltransferase alpha isoform X1 [Nilaparvata lugens]|uniref:1-acyl-sn-glycerol-3-phosphate acyltransferase alpha isoform X1 n=1 Tax=Nilaparvata lugens TaxID=108931 RepID=UPI00193CF7FB|nr:1-acyl-sn-glycerol-3-phosphate acyltransferase alpha isoform X1 [Nilaparvata lugens]